MTSNKVNKNTRTETEISSGNRRSARLVLVESGFGAVAGTVGQRFTAAFAIYLGASALQIGMLSGAMNLFMVLSQLSSAWLIGIVGGRKRMLVIFSLLAAIPFVFLAIVPFIETGIRIWALVLFGAFAVSLSHIGVPAWGSLVSDLVPKGLRGRFLGLKGTIGHGVTLSIGLLGAILLDGLGEKVAWGFVILFSLAFVARFISASLLYKISDPNPGMTINVSKKCWKKVLGFRRTKVGKFNCFILLIHVCIGLSIPFVPIYLLRDLDVSYFWFISMGVFSSVASMIGNQIWGRIADHNGTALVLGASVTLMVLQPLLWLFSTQTWFLFATFGILGLASGGWNIALYKFALENAEDSEQPVAVGAMVAIVAVGLLGGALIGGVISGHLPILFNFQLLTLFLFSSIAGLLVITFLLPSVLIEGGLLKGIEFTRHQVGTFKAGVRHGVTAAWHLLIHF